MSPEERLIFLAGAIEAAPAGSPDWFFLVEIFALDLRALVAGAELVAAKSVTQAVH